MKRVLITGVHGYIGESFEGYVKVNYSGEFETERISLRDDEWSSMDFSLFDVVFHCAAIVHRKEDKSMEQEYIRVNCELTRKLALKAKAEGVKQFVFMSSMSVYGIETGKITGQTAPMPESLYGKSKLLAEKALLDMNEETFRVSVIRAPMVYGSECKGNYQRLSALARRVPLFPSIKNQRSMIFIDNLSEFVVRLILCEREGVFCPQNSSYVSTSDLVKEIAKVNRHIIGITPLLNPIVLLGKHLPGKVGSIFRKVWGDLYYEAGMSDIGVDYEIVTFEESVVKSEQ